jgi:hypothetical protein
MREFRAWFDHHQIQPTFFQPIFRNSTASFEIGFKSEDEADLFRQEFGGVALPAQVGF